MTGTPSSAYVGKTVTYNIGVTNLGPLTANGVTVGDVLPGGVSLVSSTASQGTVSVFANAVTWSLNQPLAVGSSATLSLVTAPSLAGTIVNTATVSGLESDLDQANNSAQVTTTVASPVQAVLSASIVNNEFHMTVTAQPGFEYLIQAKMNLLSPVWVTVSTNTASASGIIKYTNTDAPNLPYRFYRTKQQ
jgi:uncharacterized repeat protein (TIGR01451 family)